MLHAVVLFPFHYCRDVRLFSGAVGRWSESTTHQRRIMGKLLSCAAHFSPSLPVLILPLRSARLIAQLGLRREDSLSLQMLPRMRVGMRATVEIFFSRSAQ
jgi:hypothetical protein